MLIEGTLQKFLNSQILIEIFEKNWGFEGIDEFSISMGTGFIGWVAFACVFLLSQEG